MTEASFLNQIREGDVAYVWDDVSTDVIVELKSRGILVFAEKFNGPRKMGRAILEEVYCQAGLPRSAWPYTPSYSIEKIEEEIEQVELS